MALNGIMLDVTVLRRAEEALAEQQRAHAREGAEFEAALRRQAEENRHQALHDDLTGLANRRHFHSRLREMIARGDAFVLLLVDLDGFKQINDRRGHACGDALLQAVAGRMSTALRAGDLLARIGGDEFAALVADSPGADPSVAAERLLGTLSTAIVLDGHPNTVRASVGVALHPSHARSAESLLHLADTTMYAMKRRGGGLRIADQHASGALSCG